MYFSSWIFFILTILLTFGASKSKKWTFSQRLSYKYLKYMKKKRLLKRFVDYALLELTNYKVKKASYIICEMVIMSFGISMVVVIIAIKHTSIKNGLSFYSTKSETSKYSKNIFQKLFYFIWVGICGLWKLLVLDDKLPFSVVRARQSKV